MPPKRIGSASAIEVAGEITAKIVILGDAATGKTSIATRFTKDDFTLTTEPTIGAAFASQRVTVNEDGSSASASSSSSSAPAGGGADSGSSKAAAGSGASSSSSCSGNNNNNLPPPTTVKLDIWDTAGQERFRSLTPMYFRGAVGGLVVYDVSSGDTFRRVRTWIADLRKARENIAIVLVGNKCDLPKEKRQVSREDGEALAEEEDLMFFECSAKTGENVTVVFEQLSGEIVRRKLVQPAKPIAGVVAPGSKGAAGGGAGGEKKCAC